MARKSALTARDLAAQYAREWFDSLMAIDGHMDGHQDQVCLNSQINSPIDAVALAIAKENEASRDRGESVEDFAEFFKADAAFMVGVQVGLRLRGGR